MIFLFHRNKLRARVIVAAGSQDKYKYKYLNNIIYTYIVYIRRVYTSSVLTQVKYNPGQNNPGYICVASTHNIPHARARHCDGGKPSRNRYFNLSML